MLRVERLARLRDLSNYATIISIVGTYHPTDVYLCGFGNMTMRRKHLWDPHVFCPTREPACR
jgi:hypothetical protein